MTLSCNYYEEQSIILEFHKRNIDRKIILILHVITGELFLEQLARAMKAFYWALVVWDKSWINLNGERSCEPSRVRGQGHDVNEIREKKQTWFMNNNNIKEENQSQSWKEQDKIMGIPNLNCCIPQNTRIFWNETRYRSFVSCSQRTTKSNTLQGYVTPVMDSVKGN